MTNTTIPTPDLPAVLVDARPQFFAAADLARSVVAAVRPDQRNLPTPCDELDVDTLCGHLLAVIRRVGHIGRGGNPNELPGLTDHEPEEGWIAAWDADLADTTAAWRDDTLLTSPVLTPWGPTTGAEAIAVYVNEFSVHTWDLATATGQEPSFDPTVVAVAQAAMQRTLPAEGRIESFEVIFADVPEEYRQFPFAAAVDAGPSATPIERLVAFNGRTPVR